MKQQISATMFLCILFTAIGLFCGWYGAATAASGVGEDSGHSHGASPAPTEGEPELAPQTLANMGVKTTKARLVNFQRYQPVSAIVAPTPAYRQGVYAPAAGRVLKVTAPFGGAVKPGDVLLTLLRDPLPRASLVLTEEVLKPVSENLHESMAGLHRALVAVEILRKEEKRLSEFAGSKENLPILPGKDLIKAKYDLRTAEGELAVVKFELERHGLSADQIRGLEKGVVPAIDVKIWLGALKNTGFWTPLAANIYAILPADVRRLPWTVATISELVAGDLAAGELLAWFKENKDVGRHFLAIGGLLQQGHSLADIKDLHALQALEEVVQVRTPAGAPDWDVQDLLVKPGQMIGTGERLFTLENPRCLYLRAEPTDSEVALCATALKAGSKMPAIPLVAGAAPELDGLIIQRLFNLSGRNRPALFLPLVNRPFTIRQDEKGASFRTWEVRPGQRYQLRIPKDVYKKVYLFPTGAVVDDGPDKIVFIQSGSGFKKIKVAVLYQDHEVVVLPASVDFFPGNPIVTSGAFALKLAYGAASDGAHAGCDHSH